MRTRNHESLSYHSGATITRSPSGSSIMDQFNTFRYSLLSNVTLTCLAVSRNNLPFTPPVYVWNTTGCYTNPSYNNGNPGCFPNGQTTRDVTGYHLTAKDAGTIVCSVIADGHTFTSSPITLKLSGN